MATRPMFTIDDVLGELDGNADFEDDSEDDFEGYVHIDDESDYRREGEQEVHGNVGANVEIGGMEESDSDISAELDDSEEHYSVPEYSLQPGCSVPVESERPLDYLSLLVTDDMLEHIATQTNLCAQQFISSNDLAPHSRVRRWSKGVHDLSELKRFLSIIIVMGLVRYPQIESHWATTWPFTNTHCSSVSTCNKKNAHLYTHTSIYKVSHNVRNSISSRCAYIYTCTYTCTSTRTKCIPDVSEHYKLVCSTDYEER